MIEIQVNNELEQVAVDKLSQVSEIDFSGLLEGDTLIYSESEGKFVGSSSYVPPAPPIPIKTFSAATEEELVEMVTAADNGLIDLYEDCGWRVGQERTVSLAAIAKSGTYDGVTWSTGYAQSAQTITLVLMHKGSYQLVTPVKNKDGSTRNTCSFIVGVKEALYTSEYYNTSGVDTWSLTSISKWCDGGFRSALPSGIRSLFKKFKCISGKYNTTTVTSQNYFAYAAEKEIQGTRTNSIVAEANALTQFTWYQTAANKIKIRNTTSTKVAWGSRSQNSSSSGMFCTTTNTGGSGSANSGNNVYLSPIGCI